MLTIESFKSQRIRGPAPKSQRGVTGYQLSAISYQLTALNLSRPPTSDLRLVLPSRRLRPDFSSQYRQSLI